MPLFAKEGTAMLLSPELTGVAMVSIAWVFMYLAVTAFVSATKRSPEGRPEKQMVSGIHHMPRLSLTRHSHQWRHAPNFECSRLSCPRQYWNHRVQGNMLEQAPTFFAAIWAHAMIASPETATKLGWTMLALRGLYPITWALEGEHPMIRGPGSICVFFVSMPMSAISIYLLATSAAVLNNVDLTSMLADYEIGRYFSRFFGFDTIGCVVGYMVYILVNVFWTLVQPAVKMTFNKVSNSHYDPNDKRTW